MATCICPSRTDSAQIRNPLSRNPNRAEFDDPIFNFSIFCRPNFPDLVSCQPISQNHPISTSSCTAAAAAGDVLNLWRKITEEAKSDIQQEPILSSYYYTSILSHESLESALAYQLSTKLSNPSLPSGTLFDLFLDLVSGDEEIMGSVRADLRAVKERDPACISHVHCFLNFKGFMACQAHRVAHKMWSQGRKMLALTIQSRVSEVFAMDIHPGARIGRGILFDHATGVVIGETAVIGDNVSILHNVTLGGTGKSGGDRHPKVGDGVLIGAGTCVLGNVRIGAGAKVGAGSVVLKDVPTRTTVVGNPARLVGGEAKPMKVDGVPSFTMDHTSDISKWSDYVI